MPRVQGIPILHSFEVAIVCGVNLIILERKADVFDELISLFILDSRMYISCMFDCELVTQT